MEKRWRIVSIKHAAVACTDLRIVGGRIDSDDRIARTQHQAIDNAGGDGSRVVRRMIGLQACRKPARQADSCPKTCDDAYFPRHLDEILLAHQFRNGGGLFRHQAGAMPARDLAIDVIVQQPIAELAHGEMRDRREMPRHRE